MKNNFSRAKKYFKYFLVSIFLNIIFFFNKNFILYKQLKKEENFVRSCSNDKKQLNPFENYNNPIISLVIPVFNDEKYILRLMKSIQKQDIKEIEIIFVEDCSTDNSLNIIKEYSLIDKRIKYIKNDENKGCLYSYAKGVLEAKAKYTMIIDQDDMLLSELKTLIKISIKYKKDIIDFSYLQGKENMYSKIIMPDREFVQPELGDIFFKGNYVGKTHINKKIYRTETIKSAIRTLKDEYLNSHVILHCDTLLFLCIFKNSQTYRSFGNLFSQFHFLDKNTASGNINSKYNKLFSDSIYLIKYISELEYSSKNVYNRHITKALEILEWPISMSKNKSLEFDWNKFNETINGILNNNDLNEINKKRIYEDLNLVQGRIIK